MKNIKIYFNQRKIAVQNIMKKKKDVMHYK